MKRYSWWGVRGELLGVERDFLKSMERRSVGNQYLALGLVVGVGVGEGEVEVLEIGEVDSLAERKAGGIKNMSQA